MINREQLKITLLGAAAGYLISEYFVLKNNEKNIRQQVAIRSVKMAQILWAKHMVDKEVERGRYDNRSNDVIRSDFEYYLTVAPDPGNDRQG